MREQLQILDAKDRESLPNLSKWFRGCFDSSEAVRKVWKDTFVLCTETALAEKKVKESKEDAKAREKAAKKARAAAKKAEGASQPAAARPAGVYCLWIRASLVHCHC